jgi:tungstate transport system ATP-binding protein
MTRVEAKGVKKSFAGRLVLELDLTLEAGTLYAILGENGSGKSTCLRLFSLLERPDQGEVLYYEEGRLVPCSQALRRKIVLVPDRKGLFNDTVFGNAAYGLKIRGVGKKGRQAAVAEALQAVGLWELRDHNALTLSTGEAQRLCLAMALATSPEIVLLDEPTSSLDPHNALLVEEIIRTLKARAQLVLLVTHNMFQARRLADRVLFFHQGRLLEQGEPEGFFNRPETEIAGRFVAGEIVS